MSFRIFPFAVLLCLSFQSHADNLSLGLPQVDASYWLPEHINFKNNCYNYATNRAEGSWAQPGEASQAKYETITCHAVYAAAAKDWGLTPTDYFPLSTNTDETLIALVVNPGIDYHWYRRGSNNIWSHKLNLAVLDTDSAGNKIIDPVTADRGRYSEFCGYFKVKNYLTYPEQQNAGYVRIGKMLDWPEYPNDKGFVKGTVLKHQEESKVILQLFSGRKNPSISLRQILMDPVSAKALVEIHQHVQEAISLNKTEVFSLFKKPKDISVRLDSTSIFIVDSEGIIFPRNSILELKRNFLRIILEDKTSILLNPAKAMGLQHHLRTGAFLSQKRMDIE